MQQLKKLMHKSFVALVGSALLAFSAVSSADSDESKSFMPDIPEPEGKTECVRPEDEMRKNHMKYILHQRDETMHKGIRTDTFALHECINCHIDKDSKVRYGDDKYFCSSCHNYAGVTIDCFECHNDRPSDEEADHEHTLLNSNAKQSYADASVKGASNE